MPANLFSHFGAERIEEAKLKALKQAARQGWADVSAGRYADVADDQLEDFVGKLGRRAMELARHLDPETPCE